MQIIAILSIIFPIAAGLILFALKLADYHLRNRLHITVVIITSAMILVTVIYSAVKGPVDITLVSFGEDSLSIAFRIDAAGGIFAAISAVLWPVTTIYAFSYMEHEIGRNRFYAFFTITFGVVCGIAFAKDLFTLYLFYELMTFTTLPLVMHENDKKAKSAAKKYLIYSMIGASLIFIALVFFINFGTTLNFAYGGILNLEKVKDFAYMIQLIAILGFFGFGVKAAVFPFHSWLPTASVAPTPVTALLHAVAVVKAGAFGVMRILYFCFGADVLYGTPAQYVMLVFASVTIIYGSATAFRCPHFKRRLAYSTISNLSYILLGFALLTPQGLTGGLLHMIFHAGIKISLFFCAGAVLVKGKKEYVYELEGLGRKMPLACAVFTIGSLGIMGIPPLACFISKFTIGSASAANGTWAGYFGCVALAFSAVLTVVYLSTCIIRFYFPMKGADLSSLEKVEPMDGKMGFSMVFVLILGIFLAFLSGPLTNMLTGVFA